LSFPDKLADTMIRDIEQREHQRQLEEEELSRRRHAQFDEATEKLNKALDLFDRIKPYINEIQLDEYFRNIEEIWGKCKSSPLNSAKRFDELIQRLDSLDRQLTAQRTTELAKKKSEEERRKRLLRLLLLAGAGE